MSRLPVRLRLATVFAAAMAVVLAAAGLFAYEHVAADLSRALDVELRARAQDLSALVRRGGSVARTSGTLVESGESFAEVVDRDGRVVDATAPIGSTLLLRPAELARARRAPTFANRPSVPGLDEPARLLAVRVGNRVLVVGATRENRAEALRSLRNAFLLGGPATLLVAALGGYLLAGAALRPLDATLARLADALRRERQLVADASHELRTPLALMKSELELAQRPGRTRAELERALASVAAETDRLARIADDLLVLARSEQGRLALDVRPTDVDDVLRATAERFAARAERGGRRIDVERGEPLTVEADRLRLEQALGNVVDNALRHGGGRVALRAAAADGTIELHVTDQGAGFPAVLVDRAFDRFSRGAAARSSDGAGLGLAIVRTIARAHDGEAHAANRPDGGADVWITLPRRPRSSRASP